MSMPASSQCCGTVPTPVDEAARLALLAQEARLLEFAVDGASVQERHRAVADQLERALEQAMDAEAGAEAEQARIALDQALAASRGAGLTLAASLSLMEVDGILGTSKMPVLTAVLSPAAPG